MDEELTQQEKWEEMKRRNARLGKSNLQLADDIVKAEQKLAALCQANDGLSQALLAAEQARDEVRDKADGLEVKLVAAWRESARLEKELYDLHERIAQDSEIVQRDWLSPAEAAGLRAEAERLRALLRKVYPYAAHTEDCRSHAGGPDTCDCGCEQAFRAARAALEEKP